jgi:hypothetical protein
MVPAHDDSLVVENLRRLRRLIDGRGPSLRFASFRMTGLFFVGGVVVMLGEGQMQVPLDYAALPLRSG